MLIGLGNKQSDFIEEASNWSRKMTINSDILIKKGIARSVHLDPVEQ